MTARRRLQLFYIGPLLLWMAVIFTASTHVGSGANSTTLIVSLIRYFAPNALADFSPAALEDLNFLLRKAGHVSEYAILTALAVRALQFGSARLKPATLPAAFALGVLYACSDEFHQRFVPGRSGSLRDVGIDSLGILFVLAILSLHAAYKAFERAFVKRHSSLKGVAKP